MKARFITNGVRCDFWECPNCEGAMPVFPGQEEVECEDCWTKWILNYDADFENGSWHDKTTIYELGSEVREGQTRAETEEQK